MKRPSWDEYFVTFAQVVARRSTCRRVPRGVGCVLVGANRLVSIGYCGSLPGQPHCTEAGCTIDPVTGGCVRTVHAEMNAVLNARCDLTGCTAYVTLSPCLVCTKLLLAAGITRVVYLEAYRVIEPCRALAGEVGVPFHGYDGGRDGSEEL